MTENKSNIKIINTSNYDNFCSVVAKQIKDQLNKKPDSRLALPAGHSPRGYYNLLAQESQYNEIDWRQVECFALDDYLDTSEEHSFQNFLETHLYRFTNLRANARFNPRSYDNYDQLIAERGGIDLCLLGLGVNGHIAFNEPPTIKDSWTHCVFLTNSTREANKDEFIPANSIAANSVSPKIDTVSGGIDQINLAQTDLSQTDLGQATPGQVDLAKNDLARNDLDGVPKRAVTMGINTIMSSKHIVLAVSGKGKEAALKRTLQNSPDAGCPASYLTAHPNLLVITDFELSL